MSDLIISQRPYGLEQVSIWAHPDRHEEEVEPLVLPEEGITVPVSRGTSGEHSPSGRVKPLKILITGDQNAGKTLFLESFLRPLRRHTQFHHLQSLLPYFAASFCNQRYRCGLESVYNDDQGKQESSSFSQLLALSRDEPPYLDTDIARTVLAFTRDDFNYLLQEFGFLRTELAASHMLASVDGDSPSSEPNHSLTLLNNNNDLLTSAILGRSNSQNDQSAQLVEIVELGGDHLDAIARFTHEQTDHLADEYVKILARSVRWLNDDDRYSRQVTYFVNCQLYQGGEEACREAERMLEKRIDSLCRLGINDLLFILCRGQTAHLVNSEDISHIDMMSTPLGDFFRPFITPIQAIVDDVMLYSTLNDDKTWSERIVPQDWVDTKMVQDLFTGIISSVYRRHNLKPQVSWTLFDLCGSSSSLDSPLFDAPNPDPLALTALFVALLRRTFQSNLRTWLTEPDQSEPLLIPSDVETVSSSEACFALALLFLLISLEHYTALDAFAQVKNKKKDEQLCIPPGTPCSMNVQIIEVMVRVEDLEDYLDRIRPLIDDHEGLSYLTAAVDFSSLLLIDWPRILDDANVVEAVMNGLGPVMNCDPQDPSTYWTRRGGYILSQIAQTCSTTWDALVNIIQDCQTTDIGSKT